MPVTITISGTAKNSLRVLFKKAATVDRAVKKAGLYMERETRLNFARESDPDGKPWAPLSQSTLRSKRTSAILRETSRLANSVMSQSAGTTATVRVAAAYGIYHQTGTRKMPQRRIIGISETRHLPKIRTIFEDHFGL